MKRSLLWWLGQYLILMAGYILPAGLVVHFAPSLPPGWLVWALVVWAGYLVVSHRFGWPSKDFWTGIRDWSER